MGGGGGGGGGGWGEEQHQAPPPGGGGAPPPGQRAPRGGGRPPPPAPPPPPPPLSSRGGGGREGWESPWFIKISSRAMNSTSCTTWVHSSTIFSPAISPMRFRTATRWRGSSPAVGSSSTKISGSWSRDCAKSSRCFMPPDQPWMGRPAASVRSSRASAQSIRRLASSRLMPWRDAM